MSLLRLTGAVLLWLILVTLAMRFIGTGAWGGAAVIAISALCVWIAADLSHRKSTNTMKSGTKGR